MLLGYLSFDMISDAMIRHAGADNLELVKQITKNIETVMTGFDDISNEILTNENFDRLVKMHVTLDDEHKKAANRRSIESILNGYTNTRTDIADIAWLQIRRIHYLGRNKTFGYGQCAFILCSKRFKQSGRDSLWLDTYQTEVASTGTHTGNQLVISNIKSIKGENNEEIACLSLM